MWLLFAMLLVIVLADSVRRFDKWVCSCGVENVEVDDDEKRVNIQLMG